MNLLIFMYFMIHFCADHNFYEDDVKGNQLSACWECEERSTRVFHCLLVKRHQVNNLSLTWSDWFLRGRSGSIYSDEVLADSEKARVIELSVANEGSNAYFKDRATSILLCNVIFKYLLTLLIFVLFVYQIFYILLYSY